MKHNTDDLRIQELKELTPPQQLIEEYALSEAAADTVVIAREEVRNVVNG